MASGVGTTGLLIRHPIHPSLVHPQMTKGQPCYPDKFYSELEETACPVIAGIDEAGRGPVIGPMVYGLFVQREGTPCGFRDSKKLSPRVRESELTKMSGQYAYAAVSPVSIGTQMLHGGKKLNELAREAVIKLLQELRMRCPNVVCVYVDGLGNNEEYRAALERAFEYKFVVENKADDRYPVVGGASIVAKVTRDRMVEEMEGKECGSGYPSDPITMAWMRKHCDPVWGLPPSVRHSWAPVKKLLGEIRGRALGGRLSGFYTGI